MSEKAKSPEMFIIALTVSTERVTGQQELAPRRSIVLIGLGVAGAL
jgi:hypothetical protein